jgi:hypothetical protein
MGVTALVVWTIGSSWPGGGRSTAAYHDLWRTVLWPATECFAARQKVEP